MCCNFFLIELSFWLESYSVAIILFLFIFQQFSFKRKTLRLGDRILALFESNIKHRKSHIVMRLDFSTVSMSKKQNTKSKALKLTHFRHKLNNFINSD